MYEYLGTIVRVVDGDTMVIDTDLGFYVHHVIRVRLLGVLAPELRTAEGKQIAAQVTATYQGRRVLVQTRGVDRYGRWLATLTDDATGIVINLDIRKALEGGA